MSENSAAVCNLGAILSAHDKLNTMHCGIAVCLECGFQTQPD